MHTFIAVWRQGGDWQQKTHMPSYLPIMFKIPNKLRVKRSYCTYKNSHLSTETTELQNCIHHKYRKCKKRQAIYDREKYSLLMHTKTKHSRYKKKGGEVLSDNAHGSKECYLNDWKTKMSLWLQNVNKVNCLWLPTICSMLLDLVFSSH